jgi:Helix-turn-helix domain
LSVAIEIPDEVLDLLAEKVAAHLRPRLLSKPALADYLGVKERTVKTWRETGLPGHSVGREVMYDVREVEKWVERNAP